MNDSSKMKVEVVAYDPSWPSQYESERDIISDKLGGVLVASHHIGSTAVEHLPSKPIIDIMLEVSSVDALDEATDGLIEIGYEGLGEFGIPGRRYFRKGGENRTHQIHAFTIGDDNVFRHIAFRNFLREHPDIRTAYGELKLKIASECNDDIEAYCDGKDAFVKNYEAKAIRWATDWHRKSVE